MTLFVETAHEEKTLQDVPDKSYGEEKDEKHYEGNY